MNASKNTYFPKKKHTRYVEKLTKKLKENIQGIKSVLSAQDILVYEFQAGDGTDCAIVYTDGMTNKQLLGRSRRASARLARSERRKNGLYAGRNQGSATLSRAQRRDAARKIFRGVLDGNSLLLVDGIDTGLIVGAKCCPCAPWPNRHRYCDKGTARGLYRGHQNEYGPSQKASENLRTEI